jgi:hypothetical protein
MDACLCSSTHFCLTTQEGEDEENTLSCTKDRGEKKNPPTHPQTQNSQISESKQQLPDPIQLMGFLSLSTPVSIKILP